MTEILKLVRDDTLPGGITVNDVQILRSRISHTFQEAQKSAVTHRKRMATLKELQETAAKAQIEKIFNALFAKAILRALSVKKRESAGEKTMRFCESYLDMINKDQSNTEGESTVVSRFMEYLVQFLIQGTEAKDKNVRYRVCQFLAIILARVGELNDELYDLVRERLIRRAHDKEQNVRLQAILALIAIQDLEDPEDASPNNINKVLSWAIRHDSSAEVRRAALLNLDYTKPQNIPLLVERVRDVNSVNRRAVYTHVLNEIADYRSLTIGMRESVLLHGLQDRDDSVKIAATRLLVNKWLPLADNDLVALLERLDVLNSKVAELTLQTFFKERPDSLEQIRVDDAFWNTLTPESIFMIRVFNDHCVSGKRQDLLDNQMPELTKLAVMIEFYFVRLAENRNAENEFIIQQLLRIAASYDYGDEIGRRKMLSLMREVLYNHDIPDDLVKRSVEVIKKISINERDFALQCLEIISDLTEGTGSRHEFEPSTPGPRRVTSGEKRHIREIDADDSDQEENSFHSAASSEPQTPRSTADQHGRFEEQALHYYKCLIIAQCVLELAEEPLASNIQLKNMVDGIILQAIHHPGGPIKETALRCLGLACLSDRDMAVQYIPDFIERALSSSSNSSLMLEIISDILLVFGTGVLPDGSDMTSLYKFYRDCLLDEEEPEKRKIAAEAICKLLLGEVFTNSGIIEALLSVYYEHSSDDQSSLGQILSFSLPVFCYSSLENQKLMAKVLVPSIKRLIEGEDADEDVVSPSQAMQQLINWTDPRQVVGQDAEQAKSSLSHVNVAKDILGRLKVTYSRDERRVLCGALNKLYIPDELPVEDLSQLQQLMAEVEERKLVVESLLNKQLAKFSSSLEKKAESVHVEVHSSMIV